VTLVLPRVPFTWIRIGIRARRRRCKISSSAPSTMRTPHVVRSMTISSDTRLAPIGQKAREREPLYQLATFQQTGAACGRPRAPVRLAREGGQDCNELSVLLDTYTFKPASRSIGQLVHSCARSKGRLQGPGAGRVRGDCGPSAKSGCRTIGD
jgi:hypothetical protein